MKCAAMREKWSWEFRKRSDTNRHAKSQKQPFWIQVEEELYYPCSENKGADQLRGYREADLAFVFAYADCWFSRVASQII